jgi:hypothetical protein
MKRRIITSLVVAISLMISVTYAYAIDIDGWWKVKTILQQGDFTTGEWTTFHGAGKKASYIYIFNAQEGSYGGPAWLYLWDDEGGGYIEEVYPLIYIKNNVIVLFGPTSVDANGNDWGNTIVLRPYGPIGYPNQMKGFYTLYDMENQGTPDQFVRMGTLVMVRVAPNLVPVEVKDMQVTD